MKRKRKMPKALKIILSVLLVCVILISYIMLAPFGRHRASNQEPLETDIAIPPPDSIAYIKGGIAFELSDEKRDQVYALFCNAAKKDPPKFKEYWTVLGKHRVVKYVMMNTNVEFRYEQRRKWELQGKTDDAVLFSFDGEGRLVPVFSQNGIYDCATSYRHFQFMEDILIELEQDINDVVF